MTLGVLVSFMLLALCYHLFCCVNRSCLLVPLDQAVNCLYQRSVFGLMYPSLQRFERIGGVNRNLTGQ